MEGVLPFGCMDKENTERKYLENLVLYSWSQSSEPTFIYNFHHSLLAFNSFCIIIQTRQTLWLSG
jgi:hypothetical protein